MFQREILFFSEDDRARATARDFSESRLRRGGEESKKGVRTTEEPRRWVDVGGGG